MMYIQDLKPKTKNLLQVSYPRFENSVSEILEVSVFVSVSVPISYFYIFSEKVIIIYKLVHPVMGQFKLFSIFKIICICCTKVGNWPKAQFISARDIIPFRNKKR